ncbi:hypothetical protein P152DRAFT_310151 [Eremomyces bilateralis CBS 781.70]|uniref:Uncharacterized protein n=1 Tax=Eremomyces bilateralis CBS 781.70 TaxID=1392243 RepID=A0A6G1G5Q3_9PEZI|nr:uncharacterized protein P152DRAFT_310151 [Eremomyces bilateralis CBS 781.70]KAF1813210.1 hypothetical protein P152DRAFT_310151 [Eremomyces bilateralis CBS 781.70]
MSSQFRGNFWVMLDGAGVTFCSTHFLGLLSAGTPFNCCAFHLAQAGAEGAGFTKASSSCCIVIWHTLTQMLKSSMAFLYVSSQDTQLSTFLWLNPSISLCT